MYNVQCPIISRPGIGASINYMASLTVCLQNLSVRYGGRINGVIAVGANLTLSFVSNDSCRRLSLNIQN